MGDSVDVMTAHCLHIPKCLRLCLHKGIDRLLSSGRFHACLYSLALGTWIVYSLLRKSYYLKLVDAWCDEQLFNTILMFFLVLLEAFRMWRSIYGKRDAAALLTLLFCFWGAYRRLEYPVLASIALIFAARDINFRTIVRSSLLATALVNAFIVISCYFGLIENHIFVHFDRVRYCLGYYGPTYLSEVALSITCMACYLRYQRASLIDYALLAAYDVYVYQAALTRLHFVFALSIIAVFFIAQYASHTRCVVKLKHFMARRSFRICYQHIYLIFTVASIAVALLYGAFSLLDSNPLASLDNLFEGRLRASATGLYDYGIKINGQLVEYITTGEQHFYLDNMYVRLLVDYGLIVTAAFLYTQMAALRSALRVGNVPFLIISFFFACQGILFQHPCFLYYNVLLASSASCFSSPDYLRYTSLGAKTVRRMEGE